MLPLVIIALLISLALIALFAASEAVLAATNRLRLRHLLRTQAADDSNAPNSNEMSIDTQRFIATVTIAANIPLLLAAVLTMWLALEHYGASAESGIFCFVIAITTIAIFQVAPRLIVSQAGALESLWWVRPAQLLVAVLRLPVGALMALGSMLLRPFGLLKVAKRASTPTEISENTENEEGEEIRDLVDDLVESAQASGVIEEGGKELIESIFTFGDTRVHEVMIPRPDILALPLESTPDAVLAAFQDSGFSRLPIYEGDTDCIVGILHVNDALRCLSEDRPDFTPAGLMRAPIFIPESRKIDEAFATMRSARTHLAIIMDEFGGTAGLLTVEDILEELVGEIADEHDRKVEEPLVILDERTALVSALLHTEDLESDWNLPLPSGEFDTVGGFMIEQLGRAPVIGDRVELPIATLIVHAVRSRRPHKIMIHRKEKSQ